MNTSKSYLVLAGVTAVAVLIGCGGNGTGSFSTNGTTSGNYDVNNRNSSNGGRAGGSITPGAAAQTMPGNEILFAEFAEDGTVLQRMTPDGKHVASLTKLPGGPVVYAQDPTATHVAFISQKGEGWGVFYNTNTAPEGAVALGPATYKSVGSLQFAPGGDDVVYTAEPPNQPFGVYYASTTGKLIKRLDDGDDATISPNGKWVAYSKAVDGHNRIFVVGVDGKGSRSLTQSKGQDVLPQWSKDGNRLLFTSNRDGDFAVYEVPVKGGAAKKIAADAYGGTYSPDGKKIAFSRVGGSADGTGLFVAKSDGTLAHKISDTPAATGVAYWSTPSVQAGKAANTPGAPALAVSPRAKALLKLADPPASKPKEEKKPEDKAVPPAKATDEKSGK